MALTKTPIELSSTPSIVDGGNATAITIDSSENVGIGVVPESHYTGYVGIDFGKSGGLFSNTSGTNLTGLSNNAYLNSDASAWVYKETDEASYYSQTGGTHRFSVAPSGTAGNAISWSEAMRIDSSGNLLVGTTDTTLYANTSGGQTGFSVSGDGSLQAARQTTTATQGLFSFNKMGVDGNILEFYKDGTTVGNIGTLSSFPYMYGGTGFLLSSTALRPADSDGTNSDADTDLGSSSSRFKDLYLSGGAYLGGTAAANKLDHYEEVAWTPTQSGVTLTITKARALRVGNLVTLNARIRWPSNSDSTTIALGGLPFPYVNTWEGTGSVMANSVVLDGDRTQLNTYLGGSTINFYKTGSAVAWVALNNTALSGDEVVFTVSYLTS